MSKITAQSKEWLRSYILDVEDALNAMAGFHEKAPVDDFYPVMVRAITDDLIDVLHETLDELDEIHTR